MRFVQFLHRGVQKIGVESSTTSDVILDLSSKLLRSTVNGRFPYVNLVDFLEDHQQESTAVAKRAVEEDDVPLVQRDLVKLLAPITRPDKVICVGMNYKDHCEEQGAPLPVEPVIFNKFPSCIVGPQDDIAYPVETESLDWEVELAIVVGLKGRLIKTEDAMNHVFGYTVAHDVSARDWQMTRNGRQWLLGKSMDHFCPLGPAVVTKDEIKDPHNLGLRCRVNGVIKQDGNTKELVHKTEALISYLSRFMTLLPGDVILTGTPPGVGCFRKPPEFLKIGDVVECEIDQIGTVVNKIV